MLTTVVVVFLLTLVLRALPFMLAPLGVGVDIWYWFYFTREAKRQKTISPVLDKFLLESAQWYPPLFPRLLVMLPIRVLERYSGLISILLDMLRMALLLWIVHAVGGSAEVMLVAGVIFAISPMLISYNSQLNPRAIAALWLDAMAACLLVGYGTWPSLWLALALAVLGGTMLLTHKMTTQMYIYSCLCAAVLLQDFRLLLLIPASVLVALALSLGYYRNTMKLHWDIQKFWFRNWPWIGAHPIRESPVYGEPGYQTPDKYYRTDLRGLLKRLQIIVGSDVWGYTALLVYLIRVFIGEPLTELQAWMITWLLVVLSLTWLTTFIPKLRSLGNGYLYAFNGVVPASLSLGLLFVDSGPLPHEWVILVLALLTCVAAIGIYLRMLAKSSTWKLDDSVEKLVAELGQLPKGATLCLPIVWANVIALRTHHPVMFGGHGYGFDLLQPLYPRLLVPIKDLIAKYQVKYVVAESGYLPENFIADLPAYTRKDVGPHTIYMLKM